MPICSEWIQQMKNFLCAETYGSATERTPVTGAQSRTQTCRLCTLNKSGREGSVGWGGELLPCVQENYHLLVHSVGWDHQGCDLEVGQLMYPKIPTLMSKNFK